MSMQWATLMLGLGLLVAVLSWLLAPWAIAVLFERGAFTRRETQVVVDVFRWELSKFPFTCGTCISSIPG
jgi:peptidoglycan biosynthesis protein MviN/MurJ (putative lipid II flippase)